MDRVDRIQSILIVRAFELAEPTSGWIPEPVRKRATAAAVEANPRFSDGGDRPLEDAVSDRASRLLPLLEERFPNLMHLRTGVRGTSTLIALLLAGAFILGLLSNLVGSGREIHLLAVPLWGLLLWNMGLVILLPIRALLLRARRGRRTGSDPGSDSDGPGGKDPGSRGRIWTAAAVGLASRVARSGLAEPAAGDAIARFAGSWKRIAGSWLGCRLVRLLHFGAGLTMLGLIAGMYQRGIGLEYQATWESTWLSSSTVQAWMNLILGPASSLTGITVPDVVPLQAPGSGPAAPWIHLFAATALLFVLIPRTGLWLMETLKMNRLARTMVLDLGDPYYLRLFSAHRGQSARIAIVPFSFSLPTPTLAALKDAIFDNQGAATEVRVASPVAYDGEASNVWQDWMDEFGFLLAFSAAQTPEIEVHGAFVKDWLVRWGGDRVALVLDVSSYGERVDSTKRVDERIQAWRRALLDTALPIVVIPTTGKSDEGFQRELAPHLDRLARAVADAPRPGRSSA